MTASQLADAISHQATAQLIEHGALPATAIIISPAGMRVLSLEETDATARRALFTGAAAAGASALAFAAEVLMHQDATTATALAIPDDAGPADGLIVAAATPSDETIRLWRIRRHPALDLIPIDLSDYTASGLLSDLPWAASPRPHRPHTGASQP
jgi:hypothetical protein